MTEHATEPDPGGASNASPPRADTLGAPPARADQRHTGARPGNGVPEHTHSIMLKIVRAGFFILFITVTLLAVINVDNIQSGEGSPLTENYALTILAAVVIGAVIVAVDVFTPRKRVATLFAIFFAIIGGLVVTGALALVVDLLARLWEFNQAESVVATIKVLAGICVCYLAISVVLQTQDDFRLVIPYVEFARQIRGVRPMLLDSSVLIDARILDVAQTGVLQAPLIVPRFVVNELQALADSADRLKRARGRRGLALVTRLQRTPALEVSIDEAQVPGAGADQMLIELARSMPATIVTTDAGLAQVASIQNVGVLNLHDLALALRAPVAMGDRLTIRIVKAGEQPGQGVGYLDDGTMVVVDGASEQVDEDVEVVIGKSLQTAAGRLVFAEPAGRPPADRGSGPSPRPHADADPAERHAAIPPPPPSPPLPTRLPTRPTRRPPGRRRSRVRPRSPSGRRSTPSDRGGVPGPTRGTPGGSPCPPRPSAASPIPSPSSA